MQQKKKRKAALFSPKLHMDDLWASSLRGKWSKLSWKRPKTANKKILLETYASKKIQTETGRGRGRVAKRTTFCTINEPRCHWNHIHAVKWHLSLTKSKEGYLPLAAFCSSNNSSHQKKNVMYKHYTHFLDLPWTLASVWIVLFIQKPQI